MKYTFSKFATMLVCLVMLVSLLTVSAYAAAQEKTAAWQYTAGDQLYMESEPNNTPADANVLEPDHTVSASLDSSDLLDYYAFSLTIDSEVCVSITADQSTLLSVLYSSDGELIATSLDLGYDSGYYTYEVYSSLEPGTYILCMLPNDICSYTTNYAFCIQVAAMEHNVHVAGDAVTENYIEATAANAGSYDSVVYCTECGVELSRETFMISELGFDTDITRISGKGRSETAIAAADALLERFAQGQPYLEKFDNIIIASGTGSADALAGNRLAAVKNAPILLHTDGSAALNLEYVQSKLADDGTVYLLGGTAAVPEKVENDLKAAGVQVERISGKTRYETNLKILEESQVSWQSEILVATGTNFADSLSASATGLPILLVDGKAAALSQAQKDFLSGLMQGDDGETHPLMLTILGGTGAVSAEIETELQGYGDVIRLSGKTRYETSVLIADTYYRQANVVTIASGTNFPDGLSGGPLAHSYKSPLILVAPGSEAAAADRVARVPVTDGFIMGGTGALSDETVSAVFALK